jgi:RsiW-degrading membrane proteinase PrsW (M82 family)
MKHVRYLTFILVSVVLMYGAVAFYYMNADPHAWSYTARSFVAGWPALFFTAYVFATLDLRLKLTKK